MAVWDCLIVDDEQMLTDAACEYFNLLGLRTKGVLSAQACREFWNGNRARLVLLDINLAQESGFSLCRELREKTDVPILFLSARTSDDDKIAAYALGGDDYIQKPVSLSVLLAKVKAVLKRCCREADFDDGFLRVDLSHQTVKREGRDLKLTPLEFRLLACLVEHQDQVVGKQELFERVWGDTVTMDGTLNVHIRHLREQIERDPSHPEYVVTVHGAGYRFVSPCADRS